MNSKLQNLGLTPFFVAQLRVEEREDGRIARVSQVQRSVLRVLDGAGEKTLPLPSDYPSATSEDRPTVGDWVVLSGGGSRIDCVLVRRSIFRRVAAGEKTELQLIAANVDVLFVVSSCNEEFRESRLERYLALAGEAGVLPVVVLTKMDLAEDADSYVARARSVQAGIPVVLLNALDAESFGDLPVAVSVAGRRRRDRRAGHERAEDRRRRGCAGRRIRGYRVAGPAMPVRRLRP